MLSRAASSLLLFLAGAVSLDTRPRQRGLECSDVVFSLPIAASNLVFARPPSNNEASVQAFLVDFFTTPPSEFITGTHPINSTFALHAVYCAPQIRNQHSNTLQILIHGITYNSTLWSGFGFGSQYNWHHHATSHGYHTLAIDRLGHGLNSRHHDPTSVIQTPLHIAAHHQLVSALRCPSSPSTSNNPLRARCFSKIILTGHSYGAALILAQSRLYPSDADGLILTGFSSYVSGTTAGLEFISAAAHDPVRFPGVAYGYLTFKNKKDRDGFYLPGQHDERIAEADWEGEDIVSTGEFASSSRETLWAPAKGYKGKVLVATGVYDKEFCKPGKEECEEVLRETGRSLFPDAKRFESFAVEDAAHTWMLHYGGGRVAERVHQMIGKW